MMGAEDRNSTPGFWRDRLGWNAVVSSLGAHRAPAKSFFFYLGGVTLFLLLLQVASGILLALYYRPDPAQAFDSVERIVGEVPYGDLVRGVHLWSGDLFVAALLAHVFTILVRRSYRAPHELNWLSGAAALVVGVLMAFTGIVLPWSQQAYTHARVASDLARYMPVVGDWLHRFMRGGDEVTASTLGHAFAFHVAALPAAMTVLVAAHFFFLSRKPALLPSDDARETIPLYPDFFVREAVAWVGVFVVVMTLAVFVARPLGEAADPRLPSPPGAHPPWYFLPVHQIVRAAPRELLGVEGPRFLLGAGCFFGLIALLLPFLDRRGSRVVTYFAWLLLVVLCLLTISALT